MNQLQNVLPSSNRLIELHVQWQEYEPLFKPICIHLCESVDELKYNLEG